jgi:hypothetical protein
VEHHEVRQVPFDDLPARVDEDEARDAIDRPREDEAEDDVSAELNGLENRLSRSQRRSPTFRRGGPSRSGTGIGSSSEVIAP